MCAPFTAYSQVFYLSVLSGGSTQAETKLLGAAKPRLISTNKAINCWLPKRGTGVGFYSTAQRFQWNGAHRRQSDTYRWGSSQPRRSSLLRCWIHDLRAVRDGASPLGVIAFAGGVEMRKVFPITLVQIWKHISSSVIFPQVISCTVPLLAIFNLGGPSASGEFRAFSESSPLLSASISVNLAATSIINRRNQTITDNTHSRHPSLLPNLRGITRAGLLRKQSCCRNDYFRSDSTHDLQHAGMYHIQLRKYCQI